MLLFESMSEKKSRGQNSHNKNKTELGKKIHTSLVVEVFEYWKTRMGKKRAVLDTKRHRDLAWAIAVYSVETCKQAIDGCAASDFHMGHNKNKVAYNDVTLIFRDAEHVEKFLEIYDNNNGKGAKERWLNDEA